MVKNKHINKKGFTLIEIVISTLIVAVVFGLALKLISTIKTFNRQTADTQLIAIQNINIVDELQDKINNGTLNFTSAYEVERIVGNLKLTSYVGFETVTTLAGRKLYSIDIQTYIGGTSYRTSDTQVVLTKQVGKVYE